jgi:glucose-6-phosphate-specific signal transduction histidine kinase
MSEQTIQAQEQIQPEPSMVELVVQELQNRIGQVTTQYETQMAVLKAQATQEMQQRDKRIEQLSRALADAASKKTDK